MEISNIFVIILLKNLNKIKKKNNLNIYVKFKHEMPFIITIIPNNIPTTTTHLQNKL